MSKPSLSPEQRLFIEDMTALMVPWGMPQMSGRIYAFLLLHSRAVSLDQIADDLEISKSTASVAARLLESHLLIRRQGEKGSKRVLYIVSDSHAGLLTEKSFLLGEIGRLLQSRADVVASGDAASRMRAIGRFHVATRQAIVRLVEELSTGEASPLERALPGE